MFFFLAHALIAQLACADAPLAVPTSGEPFRAEMVAVNADWHMMFRQGQKHFALSADELVCWGHCPEQGRAGGLVLTDGSLLTAKVVAVDKNGVTADSDLLGELKLPPGVVSGIVFRQPSTQPDRDNLFDRLARPVGQTDLQGVRATLLLDNGDERSGLLDGIADDTIKLETDVGPVAIKTGRATAILFPAEKRTPPTENPLRMWVGLSDGSRLLATQLVMAGQSAKLTVAGQLFAVSPREIVFLQPLGGHAVYLSDLKPTEYHQTPYLDVPWPYQVDRNATGGLLRCNNRLYLKGLGVHSAARLTYAIPPSLASEGQGGDAPKRFEADLGIDDSTAGGGSVQFRVLVDGREKFASPTLRGGNAPVPVSVDVTGAKKLELLVDYADRADVLDHANWLNARLTW